MTAGIERITEWRPAYDKRNPNPAKNYGIHGAECKWILKGDRGAVQFVIFTNWYLPKVADDLARKCHSPEDVKLFFGPMGADVGYHALTPQYDGQESRPDCPYLDGRPCFYDGSGLAAETMLALLIEQGDEAVWKALEERYEEIVNEATAHV